MIPDMLTKPCPKCQHPMKLRLSPGDPMYVCANCGHQRYEMLDEAQERLQIQKKSLDPRETGDLPVLMRQDANQRAASFYDAADIAINRGEKDEALRALKAAVELQPDLVEAHLQIARLVADEKEKRDHLSMVIAYDPGSTEALRMLMVLNGRLTQEEAAKTYHHDHVTAERTTEPVTVESRYLKCPVCGGALTTDEANSRVYCKFCGHTEPLDTSRSASDGADMLGAALLERKVKPVRWIVGEHILHCNECGAERTIPARQMSLVCTFCGSNQVIEQNALGTLQKPDGVIGFAVSEKAAQAAISEKLKSAGERFSGLFDDNRVKRATMDGVYMPFWVFDALLQVSKTTVQKPSSDYRDTRRRTVRPYHNEKLGDGMHGIMVSAVKSPPPALVNQIADFDISGMLVYAPNLLARYPAEIYEVDFVDASLEARGVASDKMREKYGKPTERNTEVTISTLVQTMSFMLVLAPVWIATLYERDGDVRTALVNGQTGKVALGKALKG